MAMPASGSIAIISAPQSCGSICAAVGLASGSLTALSVAAGKTSPHSMSEFYGYAPPVWSCIDLLQTATTGRIGIDCLVTKTHCLRPNPGLNAGDCYCISISGSLCAMSTPAGSYSIIRVSCGTSTLNQVQLLCCCTSNGCLTPTGLVTVRNGDMVLICTCAYIPNATLGSACSVVTLGSITPIVGYECLGSTCTSSNVYTV